MLREASHIVVGLDYRRFAEAGFDDIRVNCPLDQKIHLTDFFRLFLEHADKFFSYNFTFLFRIRYPGQLLIETLLGIHTHEV